SAHDACLHLQEILANWMNEITDATREEKSADAVRQRLRALFERQKFQRKVNYCFTSLRDEPLCVGSFEKTNGFTSQAFETKGKIAMALTDAHLASDYETHRSLALRDLKCVYDDFNNELQKTIPLLKEKANL